MFALRYLIELSIASLFISLMLSAYIHLDNSYFYFRSITNYRIFPENVTYFIAIILPAFQICLALLILFYSRPARVWGLRVASVLVFSFSLMQLIAYYRGLSITCGCFGSYSAHQITFLSALHPMGLCIISFLCSIIINRLPYPEKP